MNFFFDVKLFLYTSEINLAENKPQCMRITTIENINNFDENN